MPGLATSVWANQDDNDDDDDEDDDDDDGDGDDDEDDDDDDDTDFDIFLKPYKKPLITVWLIVICRSDTFWLYDM